MTRTLIIPLMLLALCLAGCETDPTQRIAALQSAVTAIETQSKGLDAKIAQIESLLAANQQLLADPNASGDVVEKLREENARLAAALAAAKPVKALWDQKLTTYRSELDKAMAGGVIDPNKEAQLYGQGITAIAPVLPAPWNAVATVAGGLVATFGGAVIGVMGRAAKAKAEQKALAEQKTAAEQAIEGIVASVDALLASDKVTDLRQAKQVLAAHQGSHCPQAAQAVQKIRTAAWSWARSCSDPRGPASPGGV